MSRRLFAVFAVLAVFATAACAQSDPAPDVETTVSSTPSASAEPSSAPTQTPTPTPTPTPVFDVAAVCTYVPPATASADDGSLEQAVMHANLPADIYLYNVQVINSTERAGTFDMVVRLCGLSRSTDELIEAAIKVALAIDIDISGAGLSLTRLSVSLWVPDDEGVPQNSMSVSTDFYMYAWVPSAPLETYWEY